MEIRNILFIAGVIGLPSHPALGAGFATFHVGNSLTDGVASEGDNAWILRISQSAGFTEARTGRFTIPGAPLHWNWNHNGKGFGGVDGDYLRAFDEKGPWDHLFLQAFIQNGDNVKETPGFADNFWTAARKKSPECKAWIYGQWAGPQDKFRTANWETETILFHRMYDSIAEGLEKLNPGRTVHVVPGGMALINLTKAGIPRFAGTNGFFVDGIHLSAAGNYMVALVHYICLYGRKPQDLTFEKTGLSAEEARKFWDVAWATATGYPRSGVTAGASLVSSRGLGALGAKPGNWFPRVDGLGRAMPRLPDGIGRVSGKEFLLVAP